MFVHVCMSCPAALLSGCSHAISEHRGNSRVQLMNEGKVDDQMGCNGDTNTHWKWEDVMETQICGGHVPEMRCAGDTGMEM